mmetsp:Transcript_51156/g.167211  ORF Transcript_51156/g.167211 Transcript_51156/m.167211 type:complete len:261 (+) Transcript_51156:51-833(+)
MPAKSLSPDADVATSPKETITQVYVCKFPSCSRSYVSTDGVRKHCRKHHPAWLAALDEQAKEGRTHNRSELYCVARPLTREEAETFAREEPRKRQRTAPEEVNRGASDETAVDSPLLSTADVPQHAYSTPQHGPAAESPRGEYVFAEHQPWAIAVQMPPLRLEDPLLAHHDSPVTFNFNEAMPPPKRGASLAFGLHSVLSLDPVGPSPYDAEELACVEAERIANETVPVEAEEGLPQSPPLPTHLPDTSSTLPRRFLGTS